MDQDYKGEWNEYSRWNDRKRGYRPNRKGL